MKAPPNHRTGSLPTSLLGWLSCVDSPGAMRLESCDSPGVQRRFSRCLVFGKFPGVQGDKCPPQPGSLRVSAHPCGSAPPHQNQLGPHQGRSWWQVGGGTSRCSVVASPHPPLGLLREANLRNREKEGEGLEHQSLWHPQPERFTHQGQTDWQKEAGSGAGDLFALGLSRTQAESPPPPSLHLPRERGSPDARLDGGEKATVAGSRWRQPPGRVGVSQRPEPQGIHTMPS